MLSPQEIADRILSEHSAIKPRQALVQAAREARVGYIQADGVAHLVDVAGEASAQHYLNTGRYLPKPTNVTKVVVGVVQQNYGAREYPDLYAAWNLDPGADLKYILDAALAEGILDGDGIVAMMREIARLATQTED